MTDPVHSYHVPINEGDDLIIRGAHDTRGPGSLSVSITRELAGLLDIDPSEDPLHLEDCVEIDCLDQLPNRDTVHGLNNIGVTFNYGDYTVFCCSCGKIAIYGDLERHKRGEMETPHSMRQSAPEIQEVEIPDHLRHERPGTPTPDRRSPSAD
jgi:hypothetical protein